MPWLPKAVAFKQASEPEFADYQRSTIANAQRLASKITSRGHRIVSGGTDNHVFLIDVASSGTTGKVVEEALEKSEITVNKNTIPFDTNPPLVASGIRIGTPAVTTRNMGLAEMDLIGDLISDVLENPADESNLGSVEARVIELTDRFPLYEELA